MKLGKSLIFLSNLNFVGKFQFNSLVTIFDSLKHKKYYFSKKDDTFLAYIFNTLTKKSTPWYIFEVVLFHLLFKFTRLRLSNFIVKPVLITLSLTLLPLTAPRWTIFDFLNWSPMRTYRMVMIDIGITNKTNDETTKRWL